MLTHFLYTILIVDCMDWCKKYEISTWVYLYMLY